MRRLALVQLVALVLAAGPVLGAPTALVVEILRPAGGEPYLTVSVQKRIGSFQIPCGRAGVVLAGPQGLSLTTVADLSGNARFRLTEILKALKSQPEQIPLTATVSSEQAQITETITLSYQEISRYLEAAAASLVAEGNRLAEGGRFKEALEKYRRALALYPNSARASYNLALAYEKLGMMYLAVSGYSEYLVNHPEAEDRLAVTRKVVQLAKGLSPRPLLPAGAATLLEEGRKAVASGNYPEALRSYERAQSFAPWWPEPFYSAGLVLEHLGYQNNVTYFTPATQQFALFLEAADPKEARVAEVRQKIEAMRKIEQALKAPATISTADEVREFEGDWIISSYEEGGTKTLYYDGDVVKISKQRDIFYVDGPTWFFSETRFRLSGSKLVGENRPDYKELRENLTSSSVPESVVQQAAGSGSMVYTGNLAMGQDGRILAEADNLKIYWVSNVFSKRFDHVERYPGWSKFTLTRKDASIAEVRQKIEVMEKIDQARKDASIAEVRQEIEVMEKIDQAGPWPPADARLGEVWINPKDGAEMVYVPAGEFLMGSPEGTGNDDEHPQRRVYLDGFWIDKTEVTVAQYRRFCQATGRQMPDAPPWGWQDDHPVVNVTWNDAAAYAAWAGERLPTEAEWEKAARGTDGRQYPWGNGWDAGKCANNSSTTKAVGSYPSGASPYGALDMAGNVMEWCADWYDVSYYGTAPSRNPVGPLSGNWMVLRGGSWPYDHASDFRCAARRYFTGPDCRTGDCGFRCVRGLP